MAAAQPTSPESFLLDLLRPDRVRHHARRLGFVLRIGPIKLLGIGRINPDSVNWHRVPTAPPGFSIS